MYALDFLYDREKLSDFGCMVGSIDSSSGTQTVTAGSDITFNLVKPTNETKWSLFGTVYSNYITTTNPIQIFHIDGSHFLPDEFDNIHRWLNRKQQLYPFSIIQEGYEDIYFESTFTVKQIELCGDIIGLEASMVTNRPFALTRPRKLTATIPSANGTLKFYDNSGEEGSNYFNDVKITCLASGDLTITNSLDPNNPVSINGCTNGEVISMNTNGIKQTPTTTVSSHSIANNFNYNFLRFANTYRERMNTFTFTIPCKIEATYNEFKKVSI